MSIHVTCKKKGYKCDWYDLLFPSNKGQQQHGRRGNFGVISKHAKYHLEIQYTYWVTNKTSILAGSISSKNGNEAKPLYAGWIPASSFCFLFTTCQEKKKKDRYELNGILLLCVMLGGEGRSSGTTTGNSSPTITFSRHLLLNARHGNGRNSITDGEKEREKRTKDQCGWMGGKKGI